MTMLLRVNFLDDLVLHMCHKVPISLYFLCMFFLVYRSAVNVNRIIYF